MNKEVDWGGGRRGREGRLRHGVKMQIMKRGGGEGVGGLSVRSSRWRGDIQKRWKER